ncbi:MAG: nickel-dependent lactate racemase [Oscillospiraceae bacterium]|nr:nickel-dependent lactate racemase [Oscillospiraceae bacterium]
MRLEIGFGTAHQTLEVPDSNLLGILKPNEVTVNVKGKQAVKAALERPIGATRLGDIVKPNDKTVIITSDITRPVPSHKIIPEILDELATSVDMSNVTVVFALGSHRKHTTGEMKKLVGEDVFSRVKCIDGDPDNYVRMGTTKRGTPVDVTRIVAEADRRIGVGSIEYHYFAGYSGGAKAIMPGVSTRAAIQSNHRYMVRQEAMAGRLEGNPVREDIEEALNFCPLDFIVNVVLDEHKEIIYAVAGDALKAHRAGCKFLDRMYRKDIEATADIVIASQGGAPKDINLYQTQKALDNAKHAVKKGGVIILVGSCNEGLGEEVFEEWMTTSVNPASMVERIQQDFQLGGHKAAAIAMVLENADIYLVSEMDPQFVEKIFLKPFAMVQEALDAAFEKLGWDASVLVMPYAGSTLPVAKKY